MDGRKYKKRPMGYTMPKELLDEKSIATLPNRHRSEIASLWQRDSLTEWSATLGDHVKNYEATQSMMKEVGKIILSGEKCDARQSHMQKCPGGRE